MPTHDQLHQQLDRLAAYEPDGTPVVSLYLDTRADQHGRDRYDLFLRRAFKERARTFEADPDARASLEGDLDRINKYLERDLQPSANGVAVFSASGRGLFEALQLAAGLDEHWLSIDVQPQLYPLARVDSQYPRYAAVLADTAGTRIFVFSTGELVNTREVRGEKTRGRSIGGWSQNRYQRRVDNAHAAQVREAVEVLDRVVRAESIHAIVLAGDDSVLPIFRQELPKHLAERVVEDMHLPAMAAAHEVMEATREAMARHNAANDRQKVEAAIAAHRGNGLAALGVEETLAALEQGQVDELLIAASLRDITAGTGARGAEGPEATVERGGARLEANASARVADTLVTKARQTSAKITFIEDGSQLAPFGGAAALLRFKI